MGAWASREKRSQQLGHAWELVLLGCANLFGPAIGPSLMGAVLGLQNGPEMCLIGKGPNAWALGPTQKIIPKIKYTNKNKNKIQHAK